MPKKRMLTYRGAVSSWECDSNGHMNVMYYVNKYELAGRNLFVELGMTKPYMEENNYGVAVVEQHVKYLREVFEDDVLYIESEVEGCTEKVVTFSHELKNGTTHQVVGTSTIKLVIFDKYRRKAVKIPYQVMNEIVELMGDD